MELKINRQHIFQAIKELQVIEKLPRQALQEFCRVFKVNDGGPESGGIGKAFQNKIADIICQEGEGFQDYLHLPKFKTMGHQLNQKLNSVFRRVWHELPAITGREQISQLKKELAHLTPTFQTSTQYATFHLKLLQVYRASPINPANSTKTAKKQPKPKSQPNHNQAFFSNNSANNSISPPLVNPPQQSNPFPYFPFPPPATYPKVQAQEEETYILNNKQQAQLFQMPRFSLQSQPFQQPMDFYSSIDPKHIYPLKKDELRRPLSQNLFSEGHFANVVRKFKQYDFINCVCEGKAELQEQNNFMCTSCHFSYHFTCLRSPNPATEERLCPICKLRRDTIYCQVIKEPLKFSWFIQEKHDKDLKVQLTLEQSQEVHEARKKGFYCQIRFLKLDGKKKETKLPDGFIAEGGILHRSTKHSEITLPQLCQDIKEPISLEIMLRSDEDKQKEKDQSSKLFFFGVFLVNIRSIGKIVQDLIESNNSVPFEYYNSFFAEEGQVDVSLKGQGYNGNQINYPVRGSNCNHAAFFDFKSYLQLLVDLKKDKESELYCPICSALCPNFLYDSFALSCIRNLPDYEEKRPEAIRIRHDKQIVWVFDQQESQGNEDEGQNGEGNDLMEDPSSSEPNEVQS